MLLIELSNFTLIDENLIIETRLLINSQNSSECFFLTELLW